MNITLNRGTAVKLEVLFGTDAEFFVADATGKPVAGSVVVPGTKELPHQLENGVCHPDGLSVEVGCPPSDTPQGMIRNLMAVLDEVYEKYMEPHGFKFINDCTVNTADFGDVDDKDLEFGCGFEYSAYSLRRKVKNSDDDTAAQRHAGFHIHFGFTEHNDTTAVRLDMAALSKSLDTFMKEAGLGTTVQRARQYGGYGAYRVKPYGMEYRALDCRVITNKGKMRQLLKVLDRTEEIFNRATVVSVSSSRDCGLNDNQVEVL